MPISASALRVLVYDVLVERGRAPSLAEIAAHFGVGDTEARDSVKAIRIGKTILPHPETNEIWMAGPFSAVPTPYRVIGRRASWWANCAWDMLGIPVIVGESVDVEAQCTDCGTPMRIPVTTRSGPAAAVEGLVHFLVPARRWYNDIGFT